MLVTGFFLVRARRKKRVEKKVRDPSAFVLLDGNLWETCSVDDVREPWGRYTTEPVRGFCGVGAGRHRIRTTTPAGDATLDFVVYPGEVLAWRLDTERARWEPHDLDLETRASLEGVPASATDLTRAAASATPARPKLPGWLVHLRTTVGLVSSRGSLSDVRTTRGEDGVARFRRRLGKLVARAEGEPLETASDTLVEARGLGEALIGVPLTRRDLRSLVGVVREAAGRLSADGDNARAMNVVGVGLAVLPGDPELMVVAGCTLAMRGETDEATRALNAALERDRCLDAEDVARAMRARMDVRSRLGRSVRV